MKPHFPFHAAYDLSNDLLASAKSVKQKVNDSQGRFYPCSALDFHVLYDVSNARLARIRTGLHGRPRSRMGGCGTGPGYTGTLTWSPPAATYGDSRANRICGEDRMIGNR